jgi:hypothetical protein
MVHLCRPAHLGDQAFTDKTGGCNCKVDVVKKTPAQAPERVTQASGEVTGGADSHC